MSSTNRGAERVEEENYPTPAWAVRRLLEAVELPRKGTWLEPCVGDGAIVRVVDAVIKPARWVLVDKRDTRNECADMVLSGVSASHYVADYKTIELAEHFNVAFTNPPFSLAVDIIQRALTQADWVVMLLRQGFKSSAIRAPWLRSNMPDEYSLPDRPNFIASYKCKPRDKHDRGCGWTAKTAIDAPRITECPVCARKVQRSTSDSADYSWFVWTPERGRRVGKATILESTSKEERHAA